MYVVVFNGEVLEGFQPVSVKAHMAKMLKADATKMTAMFSGKSVVLKRTPDKEIAAKYGKALKKVGADVKVRIIKVPAAQAAARPATPSGTGAPVAQRPAPQTQSASTTPAVPAGNLSLAPNEGNLFEPLPVPEPVEVDISSIRLASTFDDSPLAPPREVQPVQVDLSNLSVATPDDTPLAAPRPEPAKVEAPDFGLDEPGAVLETLREEKEPVNPDISGLSLAFPGTELLNPDEKPKGPPPVQPDISKLHLEANFDL